MGAVIWRELKDSRYLTLGLLGLSMLFLWFDPADRETGRVLMRVLLLPLVVGVLGARFMAAETEDERVHLQMLPLPFPGFFGIRLVVSGLLAVTVVTGWFLVELWTRSPYSSPIPWDDLGVLLSVYAFLFGFSGWLSLWMGNAMASCSMAFFGSILVYMGVLNVAHRPFHLRGPLTMSWFFGMLAVSFLLMLACFSRTEGMDEGPRWRTFRWGLVFQVLLFGVLAALQPS